MSSKAHSKANLLFPLALIFYCGCESEVAYLHVQVLVQKQVAKLQVAVNDLAPVHVLGTVDDLLQVVQGDGLEWRQEGVGLDGEEVPALLLALVLGGELLGVHLDVDVARVDHQ